MGISSPDELQERLRNIKHVALDMDGTIYKWRHFIPFYNLILSESQESGIGYSFLTNNPSRSTDDYLIHLKEMGIEATREEMYTTAVATIDYLQVNYPQAKRLFILGTPSMIQEFEAAGFISTEDDANDIPDAVVVSFDKTLSYTSLCRAAWWISKKLLYIATNPDRVLPN